MPIKHWKIKTRLSFEELTKRLEDYNDEYAGVLVRLKKNGETYRISHFSVLNQDGEAEYGVNYHPYSQTQERDFTKIRHTRPAKEFFDGRFEF